MVQKDEPEALQNLKFILHSVNLIENAQNVSLITTEEREAYVKALNDKSHVVIDNLIKEL